ncbi:hypothetical protein PAXRUDRAFT_828551 [Paxillus rubicundulus Ve08.2h10]|uniref:Uncharacterized protein n=1 Tax=Paxillus rubicundulus Ve08.2h10 TaxID=930991 RepID=A0A0D0DW05_9AGAM|nr:hypothetical protein PAXRUDRAFT_828551 [Paxillus rubicundulus Ve08.2h10]
MTQEDDAVINLLKNLQKQICEEPKGYHKVLDSLHGPTGGTAYEWIIWIIEEQDLALVILVRFGPPWRAKRFLLRRPDLLEGRWS